MSSRDQLQRALFQLLARTPLRKHVLHRYDYMFEPAQLVELVGLLEDGLRSPGSIVEIGCAYGWTTVFLNRYLDDAAPDRRYFAIDTFNGFTPQAIREERRRGRKASYRRDYKVNSHQLFKSTMALNNVERVTAIQADASDFDYTVLAPIAFCLIDVDLYEPVSRALNRVWDNMSLRGVIAVDDCNRQNTKWRGGYEAYSDFVSSKGLPHNVECTKIGVIRRPISE